MRLNNNFKKSIPVLISLQLRIRKHLKVQNKPTINYRNIFIQEGHWYRTACTQNSCFTIFSMDINKYNTTMIDALMLDSHIET
jgi:hypothetical protein